MHITRDNRKRPGIALVETAIVISMALLLLFGIFEYSRFLFTLQLFHNAAREGARMAIANTDDMTTANITTVIQQSLANQNAGMPSFSIAISGLALRDRTDANGTVTRGTIITDWTQAAPTDGVVVTVSGTFVPALPTFLSMPNIPIIAQSVM